MYNFMLNCLYVSASIISLSMAALIIYGVIKAIVEKG